jgi:HAD superfamily hydrolase (TIGR01509 family)
VAVSQHFREEAAAGIALKAGVVEILDALDAAALPRAIATSSSLQAVHQSLGRHGLVERFHALITRDVQTLGKPHPEPFLKAAMRSGVDPADCLALEDSHNGVRAAASAGMMTVMVPDMLDPDRGDARPVRAHRRRPARGARLDRGAGPLTTRRVSDPGRHPESARPIPRESPGVTGPGFGLALWKGARAWRMCGWRPPRGRTTTASAAGPGGSASSTTATCTKLLHSISIAADLAHRSGVHVEVWATNAEHLDYARDVVLRLAAGSIRYRLVGSLLVSGAASGSGPRHAAQAADPGQPRARPGRLRRHRHAGAHLDRAEGLGVTGPAFIHTGHGAGDRAGSLEARLDRFDLAWWPG